MTQCRKVYGLTGGIATGKSTVSAYLEERGYKLVDADKIAHSIMDKGKLAYKKVLETFDIDILDHDNRIDRKKLGNIVFNDRDKLKLLNQITHPLIMEEIGEELRSFKDEKLVFLDIPLLIETSDLLANYNIVFDSIILVYASPKVQLERLMKRDSISKEEASLKIAAQMPLEEKLSLADHVIKNDGNLDELYDQLEELLACLKG